MLEDKEKSGLKRCPYCGATDISFDAHSEKLKCNYCRAVFELVKANEDLADSSLAGISVSEGASDIIPDEDAVMTFKCGACGAEVVVDTNETTSARCHWCRHVLSVNDKVPNGAVPDMVLPFKLDKAVAEESIRRFVKKREFFAHPKFKKEFKPENVMGVYLPYMVVDANTHASFVGQAEHLLSRYDLGEDGKHIIRYDAELYDVEREFDLVVDDLTIEASKDKLDHESSLNTNNVINSIMPFDTENCVAWDANLLRGFASEKRDAEVGDLRERVRLQVQDIARCQANTTMEYYDRGARWDKEELVVKGAKWKATYLPIWLYSYLQETKGKKVLHYVAVNARTCETMGSIPLSKGKLLMMATIVELVGATLGIILLWAGGVFDPEQIDANWMGIIGFLPGFVFYWLVKKTYRGTEARHHYESETKAKMENLRKKDVLVKKMTGLKNSWMKGANNTVVYGAGAGQKGMSNKVVAAIPDKK